MSRLDELIAELCPSGVKYVPLKQIAEVGTGSSDRVNAVDDGEYPFYVRSKNILRSNRYLFDEEAIIIPGEGGIGDIFHYVNGKFDLHQRAYRIHLIDPNVNTKFTYYCLSANFKKFIIMKAVNATVTSIRKPMIENFQIPIPPLPVQQEIVRILDTFTELNIELNAELEARKKQYEYYRDLLLTFDDEVELIAELCPDGVEYKLIGDVCDFINGFAFKSSKFQDYGEPILRISNIQDEKIDTSNLVYFNLDDYTEDLSKYIVNKGDIVVAMSGATTGKIGVNDTDSIYYLNQRVGKFVPNEKIILNRFLYHILTSKTQLIYQISGGGAQPNLSSEKLKQIKIPLPPLPVQQEIVRILDNFTELIAELTAELTARQKQYEYYRDKLLSFKEVSS